MDRSVQRVVDMVKALVYDIEVIGLLGWTWGLYDQNVLKVVHPSHILTIAYKWLGEKKVHCLALPDYKLYKVSPHDDKELAKDFWEVIDEADIVVGHNSNAFDNKIINSMFIRHKLLPPSPYKQVDTLRAAKSVGKFTSNKLDDLGDVLNIGRKKDHEGFDLWLGCDNGHTTSWKKMIAYNKQDVVLTEKLYLELRPWITNHPAMNVYEGRPEACPKCGRSKMIKGMKYTATNTNLYQYYRCKDCGGMAKARVPEYKQAQDKVRYKS